MGRRVISVIIVIFFIVGCSVAVMPFAAELYAGRAIQFENSHKLDSAIAAYRKALQIDPLNAKYYGEIGRLYLKKAGGIADTGLRMDAKEAYAKAIELSPSYSKYRIGWGEAESLLLRDKQDISERELTEYIDNFKKAVESDPTNYYVNSTAGYYILLFRDRIGVRDRNFAIYRMRLALEQNPGYADQVFSCVANGLGDYKILEKITPKTPYWDGRLRAFLRNIDKWRYGSKQQKLK